MKTAALIFVCSFQFAFGQNLYFPPLTGNQWDTVSPSSLGWCQNEIDTLYDYLGTHGTRAFIVLKDGKIALEKYFGTFTKDSTWYWASAGKTITSMLVGIAQENGLFSIQDSTVAYLGQGWTSCSSVEENRITVRDHLTMTTGLDDGVSDPDCTDPACLNCIAAPGNRWAYHNGPYTLLTSIIEMTSGQNINAFVLQNLTAKTGMTGAYLPLGDLRVFFSKPREMARFGLLMLNRGVWDSDTVLRDSSYFNAMVNSSQNLNESYGYLWWLNGKNTFMMPQTQFVFSGPMFPNAPADMFSGLGKSGQFLNIVPSENLVMIRMGDNPGSGPVPALFNDTIWKYFNEVKCLVSSNDEAAIAKTWSVYPNPSNGIIRVSGPKGQERVTVEVRDITGRLVSQHSMHPDGDKNIELPENPGVYFVNIDHGKFRKLFKVIRN